MVRIVVGIIAVIASAFLVVSQGAPLWYAFAAAGFVSGVYGIRTGVSQHCPIIERVSPERSVPSKQAVRREQSEIRFESD